jgi:hypothetical protein
VGLDQSGQARSDSEHLCLLGEGGLELRLGCRLEEIIGGETLPATTPDLSQGLISEIRDRS